jgi:hypothetical protein
MYIPDWRFKKDLVAYDSKLLVRWIPGKERWGIYRATDLGPILVHLVSGPAGEYRPLDERVLRHLRRMDTHRRGARAIVEELEARNQARQVAQARAEKNDYEAITSDIAPQVRRETANDVTMNIPKEDKLALLEQHLGGKEKLEEALS